MNKAVLSIFSVIFSMSLCAQTTHNIEAGGGPNGPTPYYSPQFLTIQVGDIVRWTNAGGTHNVDGTLETFPDNPEEFTSGPTSNNLWVFDWVFDIPGVYEFECAAFDHADTQFGTITVVGVGITEYSFLDIELYPNPVSEFLTVSITEEIQSVTVRSLDLKEVNSADVSGLLTFEEISVSGLKPGTYLLEVQSKSGVAFRKFIKD